MLLWLKIMSHIHQLLDQTEKLIFTMLIVSSMMQVLVLLALLWTVLASIAAGATILSFTIANANIPRLHAGDLNNKLLHYIQNNASKAVDQAAKSIQVTFLGLLDLSTSTTSTFLVLDIVTIALIPVIHFTNNTQHIDVTQFVVEYAINGGTPVQQTYNGNLTQGQSTAINFPNTNLAPGLSTVNYNVVSVNGAKLLAGSLLWHQKILLK